MGSVAGRHGLGGCLVELLGEHGIIACMVLIAPSVSLSPMTAHTSDPMP